MTMMRRPGGVPPASSIWYAGSSGGVPTERGQGIYTNISVSTTMAELNPNCNCPKTECPRHGNCMECVEYHKSIPGGKIPYCLRFMVQGPQ